MKYDNVRDFANAVAKELNDGNFFDGDVTITVREVVKSGMTLTGLMFSRAGSSISPTAYVDAAFEDGIPVSYAAASLYKLVKDSFGNSGQEIDLSQITNWDRAKDNLYPMLVPKKGNEAYLETVASTPFLDLALIFKVKVDMEEETPKDGVASVTVTDTILKTWGKTLDEVREQARIAAKGVNPIVLQDFSGGGNPFLGIFTAPNLAGQEKIEPAYGPEGEIISLYVLSNEAKLNGSGVVEYGRDVLATFAKAVGVDRVAMLPSSIHEWLLSPDWDRKLEGETALETVMSMANMVKEVNATQLAPNEILSDAPYFYVRETDEMLTWFDFLMKYEKAATMKRFLKIKASIDPAMAEEFLLRAEASAA